MKSEGIKHPKSLYKGYPIIQKYGAQGWVEGTEAPLRSTDTPEGPD